MMKHARGKCRAWSDAEVATLKRLARDLDEDWDAIGAEMNRSRWSCSSKFYQRKDVEKRRKSMGGKGLTVVPAAQLADLHARATMTHSSLTAAVFGDPLPGRSALDRKQKSMEGHV